MMDKKSHPDWAPQPDAMLDGQIAASDDMRRRCPGASLARLELRILVEKLARRARRIAPVNADYPAGGLALPPLRIDRAVAGADTAAPDR